MLCLLVQKAFVYFLCLQPLIMNISDHQCISSMGAGSRLPTRSTLFRSSLLRTRFRGQMLAYLKEELVNTLEN